ncbi:SusC/RagA family TonB-linked outer membrane protein [Sunxiuqinia sp. sy24]|uniref:SusC/RagA family TonB-linked outer membrane protein n=1 Tax=Sunxiuqinia sp. sy24 TaxID=3461495 RepID=UPI0040456EC8
MKNLLFAACLLLVCTLSANAQSISVKGKVLDEGGVPIPGATVIQKGTTNGAITDLEGNFIIQVKTTDDVLIISFVGMRSTEVVVGQHNDFTITLESDVIGLEEVVAIGYGTTTKKDLTGSVASVRVDNTPLVNLPNLGALQVLQGTTTGVNIGAVTSAGGSPGLSIRGQNSITGSNSPLIVLDGMIFTGSWNEINTNDISSIDVLKDASAAAIYGSRSANGVIIVTTKRGKSGKPVINFNSYLGIQNWTRVPDMRKGKDFLEWRRDNLALTGVEDLSIENILGPRELEAYNAGHQMDWMDEVTQFAPIQNYQASISGATEKVNYYVSANYVDQKGILDNDNFNKASVTAKIENTITDWLSYGVDMNYTENDYSGNSPEMYMATWYTPYSYKWVEGYEDEVLQKYPTTSFLYNPYTGFYTDDLDKSWSFSGKGFVNVKVPFIEGLNYRLNYSKRKGVGQRGSFTHEMAYANTWIPEDIENPTKFLNSTNGYKQTSTSDRWVMDNLLSYKKSFYKHSIDLLAGYTRDQYIGEVLRFAGSDFSALGTSVLGYNGLNLGDPEKKSGVTSVSEYSNIGYIGRANYSYNGKYHVTASFRRDGYSAFAEGHKFGNFPGASVAWTVSEENFIKDNIPALDYLKLRASYGKNGNQGINPYATTAGVAFGTTIFGETSFNYSYPSSLANKELSWETTTAMNLGLNFSIFDGRFSGDIDIYKSKTTDQLLSRNLPIMTGYGSVNTNIGQVDNKGFELSLNSVNIDSPNGFKWQSGVRFWLNRNKLVSLYGLDADGDGVEDNDIGSNWFIGESLGVIYNYTTDGIVQTDDTEYLETYGGKPGDVKFVDIDGKDEDGNLTGMPDGKINADDRSIIGNSNPNFRMNISNTMSYKNFELYFDIAVIAGGGKDNYYMAGNTRAYLGLIPITGNWLNQDYWTEDTPSNTIPRPDYSNPLGYGFYQSRAFARLQNLTLSYNFNDRIKEMLKLRDLKVYVSGKNLLTLTDWVGLDPENAGQIGSSSPVIRTFTMGVNLSF